MADQWVRCCAVIPWVRREVAVSLLPGVVPILKALRARQAAERLALGPAQDSGYVVVDEPAEPLALVRPGFRSDRSAWL